MTFSEIKLFQVKPDKLDEFESLIKKVYIEQKNQSGCKN
jgi:quinol monooxygenase YgiN